MQAAQPLRRHRVVHRAPASGMLAPSATGAASMRAVLAALSFACLALGACTTPASRTDAATVPQVDSLPGHGVEAAAATTVTLPGVTGTLRHHARFPSRRVAARDVDVWLPPGYDAD